MSTPSLNTTSVTTKSVCALSDTNIGRDYVCTNVIYTIVPGVVLATMCTIWIV